MRWILESVKIIEVPLLEKTFYRSFKVYEIDFNLQVKELAEKISPKLWVRLSHWTDAGHLHTIFHMS